MEHGPTHQSKRRWAAAVAASVRSNPASWLAGTGALVAAILAARLHAFFWTHAGPVGFDDGYTMALGERLIDGRWLPYVDGYSHRGPLLYWAAALAQGLTGRSGWMGARGLSTLTTYGSLLGIFATGAVAGRPLAGAFAAAFFVWSVLAVLAPSPGFAITGEGVASPLVVLALLFTTVALLRTAEERRRLRWLVAAGAAAALAGAAKQTALPLIAPIALWVVAHTSAPAERSSGATARAFAALLGGFGGVLLAIVARYAMSGELRALWYWYYTYNADIYMAPFPASALPRAMNDFANKQPWAMGAFVITIAWSLARPFALMRGRPRRFLEGYAAAGLECTAALVALVMFATACSAMRFWPHYFLCVFPFLGLVVGLRGERALTPEGDTRPSSWASAAVLSTVLVFVANRVDARYVQLAAEARHGAWPSNTREKICSAIDSHGRPDESLFVWGFSGDLYLTCHRRPASRFTYLTLVAGIVAPNWADQRAQFVARQARDDLLEDLRKARPPVLVDAPEGMGNISMLKDPVIRDYVQKAYCPGAVERTRRAGVGSLWVRADLPACKLPTPAAWKSSAPASR